MFKKILVVTLAVAGIGILAYGAVNRTLAKNVTNTGIGRGRGVSEAMVQNYNQESQGYGQRGGGRSMNEYLTGFSDDADTDVLTGTMPGGKGNGGSGYGRTEEQEALHFTPGFQDILTEEDTAALLYMYEEEKVARDVYVAMYDIYGQRIFNNISQSEQAHLDAVKQLLDGYGISYPAALPAGQFANADLQNLYYDLIAQGKLSLADALKVGATIEEVDIVDLQESLAVTQSADIKLVFDNLMHGSHNHLSSFTSVLYRTTGETYVPQYLTQEAYDAILAGGSGNRGNGGGGYRGGRTM